MPEQKLMGWLNFERAITVASLLITVGGLLVTVQNHGQRLSTLESREQIHSDQFSEMRGDIKLLLERTDPALPRTR